MAASNTPVSPVTPVAVAAATAVNGHDAKPATPAAVADKPLSAIERLQAAADDVMANIEVSTEHASFVRSFLAVVAGVLTAGAFTYLVLLGISALMMMTTSGFIAFMIYFVGIFLSMLIAGVGYVIGHGAVHFIGGLFDEHKPITWLKTTTSRLIKPISPAVTPA